MELTLSKKESSFGEVIYEYNKKQAIEDGVLIDITDTAEVQEAGFKIPVCITNKVHALLQVPEKLKGIQDYTGRLWDVCFMSSNAARKEKGKEDPSYIIPFEVIVLTDIKQRPITTTFKLWIVFNPVDGFTIMFPEEY